MGWVAFGSIILHWLFWVVERERQVFHKRGLLRAFCIEKEGALTNPRWTLLGQPALAKDLELVHSRSSLFCRVRRHAWEERRRGRRRAAWGLARSSIAGCSTQMAVGQNQYRCAHFRTYLSGEVLEAFDPITQLEMLASGGHFPGCLLAWTRPPAQRPFSLFTTCPVLAATLDLPPRGSEENEGCRVHPSQRIGEGPISPGLVKATSARHTLQ